MKIYLLILIVTALAAYADLSLLIGRVRRGYRG